MIRIVMIDDHALVRAGVRMIIEGQHDMQVIGEADDGEPGLQLIRKLKPDLALVDLHMPNLNGIEVTDRVRRAKLETHVVILTTSGEAPFPKRLLEIGASGYLTKGCNVEELLKALRQVAGGRRYLGADVAQQLALGNVRGAGASPFEELSVRELEVAMMLSRGLSAKQIGERLKLSEKTIATYKYRLFEKLVIDNVVALAHLAGAHGLVVPRPVHMPDRLLKKEAL